MISPKRMGFGIPGSPIERLGLMAKNIAGLTPRAGELYCKGAGFLIRRRGHRQSCHYARPKAPAGLASNWIPTGEDFFLWFRL
jgi:hypothetical protein